MSDLFVKTIESLQDQVTKLQKEVSALKQTSSEMEKESESVCRIQVHKRIFDWCQPPNKHKGSSGPITGTGFVLKELIDGSVMYIITAHHVVDHAIQIRVHFPQIHSEEIDAVLVGCNPQMDLAVLKVEHVALRKVEGLERGESDRVMPLTRVTALGFSLGKPHLQSTAGVISARVSYPSSRLQTDVVVHPGNSGGPIFMERQVLGIVQSGIKDAPGINFTIPITEAFIIVKRILSTTPNVGEGLDGYGSVFDRLPSWNCRFTKTNKVMLQEISSDCSFGVYCTAVHPSNEYPQSIDAAIRNLRKHPTELTDKCVAVLKQTSIAPTMTKLSWVFSLLNHFTRPQVHQLLKAMRNESLQKGDIICSMEIFGSCWKEVDATSTSLSDVNVTSDDALSTMMPSTGDVHMLPGYKEYPLQTVVESKGRYFEFVGSKTYDIDVQMNCQFHFWPSPLPFHSILDRLNIGDTVRFKVWRHADCQHSPCFRHIQMSLDENKNVYREMYSHVERIPYIAIGGVFVMSLLQNHIPMFQRDSMEQLIQTPGAPHDSILILTHILPESPFHRSESIGPGDILVAINDRKVDSLKSLLEKWHEACSNQSSITLHTRHGAIATATHADILAVNDVIRTKYQAEGFVS